MQNQPILQARLVSASQSRIGRGRATASASPLTSLPVPVQRTTAASFLTVPLGVRTGTIHGPPESPRVIAALLPLSAMRPIATALILNFPPCSGAATPLFFPNPKQRTS